MHQVVKYVLGTKKLLLIIKPKKYTNEPWDIFQFSDSDYIGHPDAWINTNEFIIHVLEVKVSWRSKAQRSVTLLSLTQDE